MGKNTHEASGAVRCRREMSPADDANGHVIEMPQRRWPFHPLGEPGDDVSDMPDLGTPDYLAARFLIERGLAAIYLIAFVVAWRQFPALCGERGLEPAP